MYILSSGVKGLRTKIKIKQRMDGEIRELSTSAGDDDGNDG